MKEWIEVAQNMIEWIETHPDCGRVLDGLSDEMGYSPWYCSVLFHDVTGMTIKSYTSGRRLACAAEEIRDTDERILDIALKYGYDNSASFSKAFTRFHEASPSEVRKGTKRPRTFFPIQISITIRGGQSLDVEIVEKEAFKVIGFVGEYTMENCHDISKHWKELNTKYHDLRVRAPKTPFEKAYVENNIGSCGVTEYPADKAFKYVFGGLYQGGEVPPEYELYEVPKGTWAVFTCIGKLPGALEELMDLIWEHWVPDNTEYVVDGKCEFELYYQGDYYNDPEYLCTKWIPVKRIK